MPNTNRTLRIKFYPVACGRRRVLRFAGWRCATWIYLCASISNCAQRRPRKSCYPARWDRACEEMMAIEAWWAAMIKKIRRERLSLPGYVAASLDLFVESDEALGHHGGRVLAFANARACDPIFRRSDSFVTRSSSAFATQGGSGVTVMPQFASFTSCAMATPLPRTTGNPASMASTAAMPKFSE